MNRAVNSASVLAALAIVIFAVVVVAGWKLNQQIERNRYISVEELYELVDEDLAKFNSGEETDPTRLLLDGAGLGLVLKGEYPRQVTGEIDEEELVSRMGRIQDALICQPHEDDCTPIVGDNKIIFDFINQTYADWHLDNSNGRKCMASSSAYVIPGELPVTNPIEINCN